MEEQSRLKRDCFNKEVFDLESLKRELEFYETQKRPLYVDIENLKQGADLSIDGLQALDSITDKIVNKIHK